MTTSTQPTSSYYERHIFFCTNERDNGEAACAQHSALDAFGHCKQAAKKAGLLGAGKVRVNKAGCLDRCAGGPIAVVYPEGTVTTREDGLPMEGKTGTVRLALVAQKKAHRGLALLGLGDPLCSSGFLQSGTPALEAVALTDVEVYALSRAAFDALAPDHGALAMALQGAVTRNLAAQLASAMEQLAATDADTH